MYVQTWNSMVQNGVQSMFSFQAYLPTVAEPWGGKCPPKIFFCPPKLPPLKCSNFSILMSVCVFIDYFCHFLYYFNLKQQIFARFARFSSISHNMNQFKLQNHIFKRILSSKGPHFTVKYFLCTLYILFYGLVSLIINKGRFKTGSFLKGFRTDTVISC